MASAFTSHLERISMCSQSISELSFPGPQRFTNAILSNHDITSLIRDTEAHERALFHLAPPPLPTDVGGNSHGVAPISSAALKGRRSTMHPARQPKSKAVAAVLGGELYAKIQQPTGGRQAGEIDVNLLLQGAERLANVYPIQGALDRIAQLKRRHMQLQANILHYEDRVAQQTVELEQMRSSAKTPDDEDDQHTETQPIVPIIDEDWGTMQDDIKELERKKKGLEERVTGMEKDLGGLLR
ncbi:hypothetical protein AMS68_001126 [Peltaster fructicola]|uniref:DASH complex subunit SPC34 n=1 Tax=Peltaster fructicola TaxID=286661 RepID=A0A6H0XLV3_9PEZI|nr:hypothetical protein AMS68_001126 [Peltaster fructicola]